MEIRNLKLRSVIALTVCIAFLGTSVVPASVLPCCCSFNKTESSCCSVPAVDTGDSLPSCCKSKATTNSTASFGYNHETEPYGLTPKQSSLKCHCSSHNKAPILTDSRSLTPNIYESLCLVLFDVDSLITSAQLETGIARSQHCSSIHPLLKSSSLRI